MADKLYDKDLFGNDYVPSKSESMAGQDSEVQHVFNLLDGFMHFDEDIIEKNFKEEFENFLEAMVVFNDEEGHHFETGKDLFEAYCSEKDVRGYELYEGSDDPVASFTSAAAQLVNDEIKNEVTRLESEEYAEDMYGLGAADLDFYTNDVDRNCKIAFKEDNHGFASVEDLKDAVMGAAHEGHLDLNAYDAGSYGIHSYEGDEDYVETGCIFLGNQEEESQMDDLPMAIDFEAIGLNSYFDGYLKGDCIYVQSNCLVYYFVKWDDILEYARDNGIINPDTSVDLSDTVTRRNVD